MSIERELETTTTDSSLSAWLAGAMVIGCLFAGIGISTRNRLPAHASEVREADLSPDDRGEFPEFRERDDRPAPSRARNISMVRRAPVSEKPPARLFTADPFNEMAKTEQPRLKQQYEDSVSTRSVVERVRGAQKSEPSEGPRHPDRLVRKASTIEQPDAAPPRPRFRIRAEEESVAASRPSTADDSPLRLTHPSVPDEPRSRVAYHVVRDGDTLESIAAVRWGSARRWRELYDLNRDVLNDPAALPVGAKLRLVRKASEPRDQTAEVAPAHWSELEPIMADGVAPEEFEPESR